MRDEEKGNGNHVMTKKIEKEKIEEWREKGGK